MHRVPASRLGLLVIVLALTATEIGIVRRLASLGHFVKYTYFADRILYGQVPRERLPDLSPSYLWLVTAMRCVGLEVAHVQALQVVGVGLAALLSACVAARSGLPGAGAIAALAVMGSRATIVNATEIEPETLILLLHAAALACLIGEGAPRRSRALLGGLLLGCSMVTRPAALLPFLALAPWLFVQSRRAGAPGDRSWRSVLVAYAGGAALPVLAILLVNLRLTGTALIMDPGTVFYEGMNPGARVTAGSPPLVVDDIEALLHEPDARHIAFRIVTSRALGRDASRRDANRYFTGKALAFARAYPAAALRLVARKIAAVASGYEAYDLLPMKLKDERLARYPFLPFPLLLTAASAGLLLARPRAITMGLLLQAMGAAAVMPAFYVSARQRNALVPALAALAGIGIGAIAAELRAGRRARGAVAVVVVTLGAGALHIEGDVVHEDRHAWQVAVERLTHVPSPAEETRLPERQFDAGFEAERAGDWPTVKRVMGGLHEVGYRPFRGNALVSSVGYHEARADLRLGLSQEARDAASRALGEAPGDAFVLALDTVLRERDGDASGAARGRELLERLHDPFTASLAVATAYDDIGEPARALAALRPAREGLPEWTRAAALEREIMASARGVQ